MESLQTELVKIREHLLPAMGQLEERSRARTLQHMVTSITVKEERQTVIWNLGIFETEQEV